MASNCSDSSSKSATWKYKRYMDLYCIAASSVLILIFLNTAAAEPTLGFLGFPRFTWFKPQFTPERRESPVETSNGRRVGSDSSKFVYYNDSTIVVAEYKTPQKIFLLSCELIKLKDESDLAKYNQTQDIQFEKMIQLMKQCEKVDKRTYLSRHPLTFNHIRNKVRNFIYNGPFSNGILLGTKWCGKGNIARSYDDLGIKRNVDRCCRQHDFCPVQLEPFQKKYNLTNDSPYTISHCYCDNLFYSCLKGYNTWASRKMGRTYFNKVQVPCLTVQNNTYHFKDSTKYY